MNLFTDSFDPTKLELIEVFEQYDGPRLFSCKSDSGHIFLVIWVDRDDDKESWIYLKVSHKRYVDIKSNKIELCNAFLDAEEGHIFLVTTPFCGKISANKKPCQFIDDNLLPEPGEYLNIVHKPKKRSVMTKAELIAQVAGEAQLRKVDAEKAINSIIRTLSDTLKKEGRLALAGFGTFAVSQQKARKGRNPQTGALIKIPAKKIVKFKPGKALKVSGDIDSARD